MGVSRRGLVEGRGYRKGLVEGVSRGKGVEEGVSRGGCFIYSLYL